MSSSGADPERIRELGLDMKDRRLAQTIRLIGEIIGFPRHLSQHVGGFVITKGRLDELCPIENATMEDRTINGTRTILIRLAFSRSIFLALGC